ncbi:MAG: sulfatase [Promethearchaeota archaeon]
MVYTNKDNKYNIVLLTIDALRYDRLGFNGYHRNVSPRMDELANRGVVFDNMFSTGPCTPPAFCSMFTATYPFDRGGYSPLPGTKKTIAEVLKKHGYVTAGFHSNPLISHFFNYHRGFTRYYDSMTSDQKTQNPVLKKILGMFESDGDRSNKLLNQLQNIPFPKVVQTTIKNMFYRIFLGRQVKYYDPARMITRRAVKWFKQGYMKEREESDNPHEKRVERKKDSVGLGMKPGKESGKGEDKKQRCVQTKPLFLWIHYMDTHDPFMPHDYRHMKTINSRMSKREFEHNKNYPEYTDILKEYNKKQKLVDLYDAEIPEVDECILEVVDLFKERDMYKETIFIITADHGEEFNEHGDYGHRAHLYDELPKVPFIIFGGPVEGGKIRGLKPGTRVNSLLSLAMLSPTILEMLGIPKPKEFDCNGMLDLLKNPRQKQEKGSHVMSCTFHKGIVTRFNQSSDNTIRKMVSIRNENLKYIFDEETGKAELYNLIQDPRERNNVAGDRAAECDEFHRLALLYLNGKGYSTRAKGIEGPEKPVSGEKRKILSAVSKLKLKI